MEIWSAGVLDVFPIHSLLHYCSLMDSKFELYVQWVSIIFVIYFGQ
jgi:hypothetical protein